MKSTILSVLLLAAVALLLTVLTLTSSITLAGAGFAALISVLVLLIVNFLYIAFRDCEE